MPTSVDLLEVPRADDRLSRVRPPLPDDLRVLQQTLAVLGHGLAATIVVSREGYVTVTKERLISADSENEQINVFCSPEVVEGEHRLVLSWETSTDLDVYTLQKNK